MNDESRPTRSGSPSSWGRRSAPGEKRWLPQRWHRNARRAASLGPVRTCVPRVQGPADVSKSAQRRQEFDRPVQSRLDGVRRRNEQRLGVGSHDGEKCSSALLEPGVARHFVRSDHGGPEAIEDDPQQLVLDAELRGCHGGR